MDISLIPCMPGIILPPSWGAYKCVLCDYGVIMLFRKASPQTEGRRNADPKTKTPPDNAILQKLIRNSFVRTGPPPKSTHDPGQGHRRDTARPDVGARLHHAALPLTRTWSVGVRHRPARPPTRALSAHAVACLQPRRPPHNLRKTRRSSARSSPPCMQSINLRPPMVYVPLRGLSTMGPHGTGRSGHCRCNLKRFRTSSIRPSVPCAATEPVRSLRCVPWYTVATYNYSDKVWSQHPLWAKGQFCT